MTRGFSNWKDATLSFKRHERSASHCEAVHIGEQLSRQHAIQKIRNRDALYQIISSIRFLSRQGLALRGDGCERDGNLTQLLLMKAESDPSLSEWMKRKENVYTSPDIQNEILMVLGVKLLRELSSEIQSSPFISIMVDETTDAVIGNRLHLLFGGLLKTFKCMKSSLDFMKFHQLI